jgi:Restriction endonuclease
MPGYNKNTIQKYLFEVDSASGKNKMNIRGKAYEQLAKYLLERIPGVSATHRNVTNVFATEEIDLACQNKQLPTGLRSLPPNFLVECKGWDKAVGSEQVAWFLLKIEFRALDFGILIAANGITGVPEELTAAQHIASCVLAVRKIRLVVITRAEIEALASGEEFARLIIDKVNRLHATGRCY